jgi:hypothetical protein
MSFFDPEKIPGFGKIYGIVERIVIVLEKLAENTTIREQFKETGVINAGFSIYDYEVKFTVTDKNKTAIPAEIEEVK